MYFFIKENGWKVLRIRWKNMFQYPEKYIKIAKNFIEKDIEYLENNLKIYQDEIKELERIKQQKAIDKVYDNAVKVNNLIDANIDFTKFGWVEKVNQITNQPNGRRWIKRWAPWLLDDSFKRK